MTDRLLGLKIDLPGLAGEFQRAGRTTDLVRELGKRYDAYHAFLVAELDRLGGRVPEPSDFAGDYDAYLRACSAVHAIVVAEGTLRRCRARELDGVDLDESMDPLPFVGPDGRLLSFDEALVRDAEPHDDDVECAPALPDWSDHENAPNAAEELPDE